MINRRIRAKVNYLRTQPEAVRLRAATTWTAIIGGIISLLWITVLLPLQLKSNNSDTNDSVVKQVVSEVQEFRESEVAGIRVTPSNTPTYPVATPTPTIQPTFIPVSTP
jgi:hypothetical protein